MQTRASKTTIWYKCLICHTCFQFPKALVVHRMKSQCRFQYKEIHKERSKWPFEIPTLKNLDQEKASRLKDSQQLLKSQETILKSQQTKELKPTREYSDEVEISVPELTKKSRNLENLKNHIRKKSDENKPGSLNFDNCKKDGTRSVVQKLQKIPTSSKFICNLCQKMYSSKHSLNLHISVVHEKITPYSCKQCSKTFGQYINLKTHISTVHQGLKPYSCKQCSKSFSQSIQLRVHIATVHERLRPYNCKQCSRSFGQSINLKTHVSTVHNGLKPYSCQQCPQSFGLRGNLKVHVSRVHKNR